MSLSFCLTTCGEETEKDCLAAFLPTYEANREAIRFYEVRDVMPAVRSLHQMIRRCETDFLVPLDADMVLYPGFLPRIQERLEEHRHNPRFHSILFPLWDTLTQEKIMALKVFRTAAIREVPYKDDPCPDILHYRDLAAAGWDAIDLMHEEPIGDHRVKGIFFCYAKYRDLYTVARARPDSLLDSNFKGGHTLAERAQGHFDFFLRRYQSTMDLDCLACIAGMVDGLTFPLRRKSKDLSNRDIRIPVLEAVERYHIWTRRVLFWRTIF